MELEAKPEEFIAQIGGARVQQNILAVRRKAIARKGANRFLATNSDQVAKFRTQQPESGAVEGFLDVNRGLAVEDRETSVEMIEVRDRKVAGGEFGRPTIFSIWS